jgi:hypothetical protein
LQIGGLFHAPFYLALPTALFYLLFKQIFDIIDLYYIFKECPMICPKCGLDVKKAVHNARYENLNVCFFKCPNCEEVFPGLHIGYNRYAYIPKTTAPTSFPKRIQELSPKTYEIYCNTFKANSFQLYDFAGVGLRMAVEQLNWDYLIKIQGRSSEEIKPMRLFKRIEEMDNGFYTQVCQQIISVFGNDVIHVCKDMPPISLNDAFLAFDSLCTLIDNELSIREINDRLAAHKQNKQK